MNLMRRDPFRDLEEFFPRTYWPFWREGGTQAITRSDWMPSVDVTETDKEFVIKVEVPEVKKEDIKISIDKGMLTISGERRQETTDEKHHRVERYYGSFTRSFSLPDSVDEETVNAEQKDGMLYLHLGKQKKSRAKAKEIRIS